MIRMTYNKVTQRLWYDLSNDLFHYRYTFGNTVDGYKLIASGYKYPFLLEKISNVLLIF